ncbi:hypothetical protein DCAR_0519275 [Daucus carota subsp. sativus]|uniref:Uncharacterized protein n=1 Tax=Daucus carota subsp. sativus TaxID=79200 RepID=A0A164XUP8_DAUCS|nr:PREDICTED: ribonuclease 3-like protein 2 [Daucus carota subsp. sativus]WOG99919.1 hypothetical protein DCAR_0519275 [Daucus carota subsp. sativus]
MSGHPPNAVDGTIDMSAAISDVEEILGYKFIDKSLLEKALTHPSYVNAESYQRLEFVGDAVLGLAITNFAFLTYPDLDAGDLSVVKAANISTEKLARVAIRHQLYKYVRHNSAALTHKVKEFLDVVQQEDVIVVHGGTMKAPKVLADIVESVIAAVYLDQKFDSKAMWVVVRGLLEPLITPDMLQQQPQPISMLFEMCQKDGLQVDIKPWRENNKNIASVYIDGNFIASASSDQKENAKLQAAKAALEILAHCNDKMDICANVNENSEVEAAAKKKLHEVCARKKWSKPCYSIVNEVGPAHARKFVCSVSFETADGLEYVEGVEKLRVKEAEGYAASLMLQNLRKKNYI